MTDMVSIIIIISAYFSVFGIHIKDNPIYGKSRYIRRKIKKKRKYNLIDQHGDTFISGA